MKFDTRWSAIRNNGFLLGIIFLRNAYRIFGKYIFWIFTYPIVIYYFLVNRTARNASISYLTHLKTQYPDIPIQANWRYSFKHFSAFAQCLLDKLEAWNGTVDFNSVIFPNRKIVNDLISHKQGAVLLCSHLGNLEICRALGDHEKRLKLNILVHTRDQENINKLLKKSSQHRQMELIQVTDISPATTIILNEKISRGEFVVIVGDRTPVEISGRKISVPFLGAQAAFPLGPFLLAAILRCPVYTLFCIRQDNNQYLLDMDLFSDAILPTNIKQELPAYIEKFAKILETRCRIAPLQWFNFYPFWGDR